ncbi:hypothetical protein, partial [Paracoccus versutus]|uniref:hypothetical protein n=1 Tax=Paracoccus versutus TaxID=34007 RepID=UPI001AD83F01
GRRRFPPSFPRPHPSPGLVKQGLGKDGWGPKQFHGATDGLCITFGAWSGPAHFASEQKENRRRPAKEPAIRGRFGGCGKKLITPLTG